MPTPTDKPTEKMSADKTARLTTHDAAKSEAERAEAELRELEAKLEAAKAGHAEALIAVDKTYSEAYAEEIAEGARQVEANDKRHKAECAKHCKSIESRRAAREKRGEAAIAHDAITVVTIDDVVHQVVAAHGLFLGTHGFTQDRKEPGAGSRYKVACGYSIDAPHDELDHERFDQTKKPDCPACEKALAAMETGEMEDARSDYLTSKEQITFARFENAKRNKASSAPDQAPE